jgi:hypothetical protein
MAQTITLTGIADSTVDQVVGDFQSEGATVTKTKQADGTWTVVAKFT